MRHGGEILVDQLLAQGVERVFSVPGESFLAALDGLYESGITNHVCRQEGGAAMMAEAQGKLTGKPGIAFVTRGPGATNASAGVHVARQDSTPMILFVGQIARAHRDREAFQEVDYRAMFGGIAKWVTEVDQIERIPEYISRAFHVATSGRPGPVVIALPEDMLSGKADVPDIGAMGENLRDVAPSSIATIRQEISGAQRPLVILGGSQWSQDSADHIAKFAEASNLPVAVDFRRQDYIDNRHPNYVGDLNVGINPALKQNLMDADLLIVLGARLGDIATSGYTSVDPANVKPRIIHVHPDPDSLGQVYRPDISLVADPRNVIAALAEAPSIDGDWAAWRSKARADYEAWLTPQETPGDVKMEEVIAHLSRTLPDDAILTNGAGNYAAFLHRYFAYKKHGTQLAPTSGSMGYGFPAAISAAISNPAKTVVCLAGDGCFQMTCNEFSTAMQYGAKVITIVANNGRYGTIRMHQEMHYPARVSGTNLHNPDFVALAKAYGGHGECVTRTEDFPAALERAIASDTAAIIELRLDSEALAPSATLSQIRERAQS
ncbi:thiamine pyrophosphate-binding protein [Falsihalocynthiibacter sp. SS001]|uniref:thiamine pyrophosphate-binding protein n=1 Tax=Falsihalocynthiibacter sp. SS001 TaxID=3349698 RepID=UPI0036D3FBC6